MGAGGEDISVWVDIWRSKVKEEVDEKRPDVLSQEHLDTRCFYVYCTIYYK